MGRNYQLELDNIIKSIDDSCVPTLLLHSCCAPCSTYVLEYLSKYFAITLYYYNPNIYPAEEFEYRLSEQKRFIDEFNARSTDSISVKMIGSEHLSERFYEAVSGLEDEPEGGARCTKCFTLRLEESARLASAGGYDYFTTTLSISPHKNAALLNALGEEIGAKYNVGYLNSDFKKRGGFQRSVEISNEYNMYRQDYCGCEYSYNSRRK